MNGVHDMGGQQSMGPVEYEKDEPVFHASWEGRIYALSRAMRAWRKWSLDTDRHALEIMHPIDYLRMSYYERWLNRLETHVVKYGFVTQEELQSGKPAPGSSRSTPMLSVATSPGWLNRGIPSSQDRKVRPSFKVGQRVRARAVVILGHTLRKKVRRGHHGTYTRTSCRDRIALRRVGDSDAAYASAG
jgi:nitrile hydratase